ncbi:MAG TPA: ATP-binding protein [Ilumatobacteraceae bacterium]|nr:ATP-binding protein [Ilumatobacteraceae bacterium]
MPDQTDGSHREQRSFPAETDSPRAARRFATAVLSRHAAPAHIATDLTLVVSELVTNFVEHSSGGPIEVIFDLRDPLWWQVEVIGGVGTGAKRVPAPATWTLAGAEEISGRGLGIVRQLTDDVVIDVGAMQVSVRCRRRR